MNGSLRVLIFGFIHAVPAMTAGADPDAQTAVIDATLERAKVKRVEADCQAITASLKVYRINNGSFPTEKQGLRALVEKPAQAPLPKRWIKLISRVPLDPWQREYRLVMRKKDDGKEELFLASQGPDPEDAADDIEHLVGKLEAVK